MNVGICPLPYFLIREIPSYARSTCFAHRVYDLQLMHQFTASKKGLNTTEDNEEFETFFAELLHLAGKSSPLINEDQQKYCAFHLYENWLANFRSARTKEQLLKLVNIIPAFPLQCQQWMGSLIGPAFANSRKP